MASVVLKNGDNFMGRFKNNRLEGFVQENISFCDRCVSIFCSMKKKIEVQLNLINEIDSYLYKWQYRVTYLIDGSP